MRQFLARILGIQPEVQVVTTIPNNRTDLLRMGFAGGWEVTPEDVRHRWGINNLASYISLLRKEGMDIETVPVTRYGRRTSLYRLASS